MIESSFRDDLAFLSNLYTVADGVEYDGGKYPTLENAFQAAKTLDPDERKAFETVSPLIARRMGRKVELRPNWDFVKVDVMKQLVQIKFAKESLQEKLVATGDE